ncbi:hypothetical protein GCM10023175_36860 [Pseudonocardia xishanensis]|uniref:Uncharacterized protein n=1 Tax=Pseudonocardia xishanensis TaxID=630995 RepID=A0ABP8RU02_9PSEU
MGGGTGDGVDQQVVGGDLLVDDLGLPVFDAGHGEILFVLDRAEQSIRTAGIAATMAVGGVNRAVGQVDSRQGSENSSRGDTAGNP